jgi:phospholipase/carboxylesterase
MSQDDLLECLETETGPNPTACVIWLHGLGADGGDFYPIVPELRLPASMPTRFVFPNAMVQPVTINGGMHMRAWYDIFVPNIVPREDDAGIRRSEAAVNRLIEREIARGIPSSKIVLAGFSQGCAITLHTGIRTKHKLAGFMGLSGYLPILAAADREHNDVNEQTPIFLAHGLFDPVVTIDRAQAAQQKLTQLGYQVQWQTYPMPHSVCPQEIHDISVFLQKVLA